MSCEFPLLPDYSLLQSEQPKMWSHKWLAGRTAVVSRQSHRIASKWHFLGRFWVAPKGVLRQSPWVTWAQATFLDSPLSMWRKGGKLKLLRIQITVLTSEAGKACCVGTWTTCVLTVALKGMKYMCWIYTSTGILTYYRHPTSVIFGVCYTLSVWSFCSPFQ